MNCTSWMIRRPVCEVADQMEFPQDSPQILIYSFTGMLYGTTGGFGWMSQRKNVEAVLPTLPPPQTCYLWSATRSKAPQTEEVSRAPLRQCKRCKFHVLVPRGYRDSGPSDVCLFCTTYMYECKVCNVDCPEDKFSRSMWVHRQQRGATCLACEEATCSKCGVFLSSYVEQSCKDRS